MCFQIPSSVYYTFFKVIFPDWSKRDSWRFPGPCADLSLAPTAALSHVYCVPLKHIVEKYLLTLNLLLFLAYGWRTSIGPFNIWKNENGITDTFWNPSLISVVCLFLPSGLPFLLKTILNRNIHLFKKYTELFYRLNYMKLSYQKKKILAPIFLNFNHLKNFLWFLTYPFIMSCCMHSIFMPYCIHSILTICFNLAHFWYLYLTLRNNASQIMSLICYICFT